jgi:peptidylprolyl isomerase/peptidyl-prolyl cis-trans isomerase C
MTEPYTLLRVALSLFNLPPNQLSREQMDQVNVQAGNEFHIENKVLNSREASTVIIGAEEVERLYQEIRTRYDDEDSFLKDLEQNQLAESSLRTALYRQCKVDTILEWVASRSATINEVEIGLYYHLHTENFTRPEQREVCHIYISINPDYNENTRENALLRMQDIKSRLQKKPYKFADLALQHSECPTALQGGLLGVVPRGKLYPELDAALFTLNKGDISDIIESEIGYHVLLCKDIRKAETVSLAKAAPKIRHLMQERAKQNCQRAWLANLATITDTREHS